VGGQLILKKTHATWGLHIWLKGVYHTCNQEVAYEHGFDRIPLARRAEAFRMNDNGWIGQIKSIERYVSQ
jgi:hypothetical protein